MVDLKRWIVTYTKHIKQKRKVYQDGFLELHTSTNKAKLYDDCEKLLECRILKQCEVVSCGETLTFSAYLVDIGETNGAHVPGLNSSENDATFTGKSGHTPSCSGVRKDSSVKKKACLTLSPSQKLIKEFKRRVHNFGSPKSSQQESILHAAEVKDSPYGRNPTMTDWQVLYTRQLTQKAKKYHDGFLSVALCGTQARKAKLYDASRTLLDSRFLRQSELINSGEKMAFEAHLIEIGDPVEKEEPTSNLIQKSYGNAVDQKIIHTHQESFEAKDNIMKGKFQSNVGSRRDCSSPYTGDEIKSNIADKPLRNSLDILSTLRKPMICERIEPETSDAVILDLPEDDQSLKASFKILNSENAKADHDSRKKTCTEQSTIGCTTLPVIIDERKNGETQNPLNLENAEFDLDSRRKMTSTEQSTSNSTMPGAINERRKCETEEFPSFDLGF